MRVQGTPVTARATQAPEEAAPVQDAQAPAAEAPAPDAAPTTTADPVDPELAAARAGAARSAWAMRGNDLRASLDAKLATAPSGAPAPDAPAPAPAAPAPAPAAAADPPPASPAASPAAAQPAAFTSSSTVVGTQVATTVKFDDCTIRINSPATPAAGVPTPEEVAQSLANLPPNLRQTISKVDISNTPGPVNTKSPDGKPYMTADSNGVVHIYPVVPKPDQAVLTSTLTHESAHLLADGAWGQTKSDATWDAWRDAMKKDPAIASENSRSSIQEDFAETVEAYQAVKGTPGEAEWRAAMPERFAIIDQMLSTPDLGKDARLANAAAHNSRPNQHNVGMMTAKLMANEWEPPEPIITDPKGGLVPISKPIFGKGGT